jgi:hypothetical protein
MFQPIKLAIALVASAALAACGGSTNNSLASASAFRAIPDNNVASDSKETNYPATLVATSPGRTLTKGTKCQAHAYDVGFKLITLASHPAAAKALGIRRADGCLEPAVAATYPGFSGGYFLDLDNCQNAVEHRGPILHDKGSSIRIRLTVTRVQRPVQTCAAFVGAIGVTPHKYPLSTLIVILPGSPE